MTETLKWQIRGERFEDGSLLADWVKIEESGEWHWQYDTHELTFEIYEHDGQYWKLYRARFVPDGARDYAYDCLLYTSPSPRDGLLSRMPSSA